MDSIALVYLARAANGPEPLRRFLEAHQQNPPGVAHELILLGKGFTAPPQDRSLELKNCPHRWLVIPDRGLDLTAYGAAARKLSHARLCFLNSFSLPLMPGWLDLLNRALDEPGVGAVGATGSHESFASNLEGRAGLWTTFKRVLAGRLFPPFPNPHLRTTSFLIRRELMLEIWSAGPRTKLGAHLFESGRRSLTRRIGGRQLDVRVVGRDGRSCPSSEWAGSRTFRSGNQENLLVADNRTRQYEQATETERLRLRRLAWGPAFGEREQDPALAPPSTA